MLVCGVDDAGRGSVLGPMAIAGVCIRKDQMRKIARMGVRDSKMHTPAERRRLFPLIRDAVDSYYVVCVPPRSIDASVRVHGLNMLEAKYMARVISRLCPDVAYVDSCDTDAARFGRNVSRMSGGGRVRSYHHADSRFAVVSAASILAKVTRDEAIRRIARGGHLVGSGYPGDRKTVSFLQSYYAANGGMPTFARKSWMPVKRIMGSKAR